MTEPATEPDPPRTDGSRVVWSIRAMPPQEPSSFFELSPGEPASRNETTAQATTNPATATD